MIKTEGIKRENLEDRSFTEMNAQQCIIRRRNKCRKRKVKNGNNESTPKKRKTTPKLKCKKKRRKRKPTPKKKINTRRILNPTGNLVIHINNDINAQQAEVRNEPQPVPILPIEQNVPQPVQITLTEENTPVEIPSTEENVPVKISSTEETTPVQISSTEKNASVQIPVIDILSEDSDCDVNRANIPNVPKNESTQSDCEITFIKLKNETKSENVQSDRCVKFVKHSELPSTSTGVTEINKYKKKKPKPKRKRNNNANTQQNTQLSIETKPTPTPFFHPPIHPQPPGIYPKLVENLQKLTQSFPRPVGIYPNNTTNVFRFPTENRLTTFTNPQTTCNFVPLTLPLPTPSIPALNITTKLRPIAIDGSNVAFSHGKNKIYSCKGIKICIDYFVRRGHTTVKAFVPQFRRNFSHGVKEREILEQLNRGCQYVVFTPSRRIGKRLVNSYDDRFILDYAAQTGAVVVSNDNYRDLINENVSYKITVENRLLMYTFADDIFMVPQDPLGQMGPSLDDFLKFSS